jgi:diguanylate cyclase (GGDEF)-like protein/PAS domain S-box-containing protein
MASTQRTAASVATKLLDAVEDSILVIDHRFELIYMNQATRTVLGWGDATKADGANALSAVHADDMGVVLDAFARVMNGVDHEVRAHFRVRHPEGKHGWKPVSAHAVNHNNTPGINGVVVSFRDLEELMADKTLVDSLTRALEHTNDFVAVHRADGGLLYANGAFRRLAEWDQLPSEDDGWPYSGNAGALLSEVVLPALSDAGTWSGEYTTAGPVGPITVALTVTGRPTTHPSGGLIIITGRDISSERQMEADRRFLELHDPVTRLPNRRGVEAHLGELLGSADQGVALIQLEVESLRELADTHQSDEVDALVRAAVQRLRQLTRQRDLFARISGDTFALVITGAADSDLEGRARTVGELFRERLRSPFELGDTDVYLHANIGVVVVDQSDTATTALRKARLTVESARSARSVERIEVYHPAVWERVQRRSDIERGLYEALANGRLRLRYQPIVDLGSGATVSFEALVRWELPDGSMVPPNDFLDVAEQVNLIADIDTFVVREACRQLSEWCRDDLGMSVNMSASQLLRPDLLDVLGRHLDAAHIEPSRLTLELTENNLYVDMAQALQALDGLRGLGVQLALDDFGTGYSSLSHLREFEVDTVKIDRSFMQLDSDNRIVEAVVRMSSSLGMDNVAEGVETDEQCRALREMGCGFGQGYLFSPAVPGNQALAVADRVSATMAASFT